LFYWLSQFADMIPGFNVFRYITFRTGGAVLTALLFVFLFGPKTIELLRVKQGKGQPIREDGPASHLITKKGTPTMGGLMILSGLIVSTLLWANLTNPYVWVVLCVTVSFGAIGLYDDYLKVTRQTHAGFSARLRLVAEVVIAAAALYAITRISNPATAYSLAVPFLKDIYVYLGWGIIAFGAFVIVGAGNAVNLTDGLDGLAIVPVMITAATFALIAYLVGNVGFSS
jgi:phospho-N-acetylmuramoyl-pentapeptide-transferase